MYHRETLCFAMNCGSKIPRYDHNNGLLSSSTCNCVCAILTLFFCIHCDNWKRDEIINWVCPRLDVPLLSYCEKYKNVFRKHMYVCTFHDQYKQQVTWKDIHLSDLVNIQDDDQGTQLYLECHCTMQQREKSYGSKYEDGSPLSAILQNLHDLHDTIES